MFSPLFPLGSEQMFDEVPSLRRKPFKVPVPSLFSAHLSCLAYMHGPLLPLGLDESPSGSFDDSNIHPRMSSIAVLSLGIF